jgi:hypothetical protein
MSERRDDDEPSGHGPILGVLFAIALCGLTLWLIQKMQDSASLLDCAFTHDPKCRALIKD